MNVAPWPLVLMLLQVMLLQYALPEFAREGAHREELAFAFVCPVLAALGRSPGRPWLPWSSVQFGWVFFALGGALATFVLPLVSGGPFLALALWQLLPHLAESRRDRSHAALFVLGPAYVLFEMSLRPQPYFAWIFPVVLLLALLGANWLVSRDLVLRGTRAWERYKQLLRADWGLAARLARGEIDEERFAAMKTDASQYEDAADRGWRSSGFLQFYTLGFVAVVLLLLPFLALPLLLLPEATVPGAGARDRGLDPRVGLDAPAGGVEAPTGGGRVNGEFPEALHLAGSVTRPRHELIARFSVHRGDGVGPLNAGPLHLRGLVLDRIGRDGADASRPLPLEVRDADDGLRDGFTWLADEHTAPARSWEAEDVLVLDVRQQVLRIVGSERAVLFAPQPLLSINRARVWADPDGSLLLPVAEDAEWLRFQLAVGRPALPEDARRAVLQDRRWLQLPDDPLVERMAARARELTTDVTTDRQRVARVVEEYRAFDYDLRATSVPGLAGLDEFLRERRGYCAYFAVAATIQLRALGIPARVATGFLADTYDERAGVYEVSSRKGHVWIEVAFDGHGWVPFDPTPTSAREAALAALGRPGGVGSWSRELVTSVGDWLSSGDRSALERFAATLAAAPAVFARHPVLVGLALVTATTLAFGLVRGLRGRRAAPRRPGAASGVPPSPESFLDELLEALADRGFPRDARITLREHGHRVVRVGGASFEGVPAAVELYYHQRYGRRPVAAEDVARVHALAARLREVPVASPGSAVPG